MSFFLGEMRPPSVRRAMSFFTYLFFVESKHHRSYSGHLGNWKTPEVRDGARIYPDLCSSRLCRRPEAKPNQTGLQRRASEIHHRHGSEERQKLIEINFVPDHTHMLIGLKPSIALSDLMRDVKSDSTEFIKRKGWIRGRFNWQEGFGAFSYSQSNLDSVIRYIRNQEEHHATKTFRNEYLTLLKRFDIAYEPKYLFEFFTDE
jgi:putative transposase